MKLLQNLINKKPTRSYANRAGVSRKMRGEYASSATYSEMIYNTNKRRRRYVYHLKYRYKLTCLVHIPGRSSNKFKGLRDFSSKNSKYGPTTDCGKESEK